jgi:hypothetical protein
VTPMFTIRPEDMEILAVSSQKMRDAGNKMFDEAFPGVPPDQRVGKKIVIGVWAEVVLVPKGTNIANIQKLNDVPKYGGKILSQEGY